MSKFRLYSAAELHLIPPPRECTCAGYRVKNPLVWPQVEDESVKRLIPVTPRPRCSFCRQPLTEVNGSWLELFDGPTLQYPKEPEDLLAAYAHAECGPGTGYNIPFPRLIRDGVNKGPQSWYPHLREKEWFCDSFKWELQDALCHAVLVEEIENGGTPKSPMRSVVASIPRRPPRTPANPRSISPGMRTRVLERDGFRCRRCGAGPSDAQLVIDHIVPVAKGGSGAFDNLQTLCRPCNAGKSDADPHAHDLGGGAA